MSTTVQSMKIKSQDEIRDDYLRTYRNALIRRGVADPRVDEGTEIHARATALAQQIYVASLNTPLAADAQMADSAVGEDLIRLARLRGLSLRSAGPSAGPIVLGATVDTTIPIPTGSQILDPTGALYEVAVGGSYLDGAAVTVRSIDSGTAANLAAGTVLRWLAPPPYVLPTVEVGAGGLTGGADAEQEEGLRSRLLENLANPPNGSNWASANKAAEESSPAVQKAFCYPAANGPSTMHVAVCRAPTSTSKGRAVDALVLASAVAPGVSAAFPEYVEIVTTSVVDAPVDVSFGVALPASTKAGGPGGGWLDADPFPQWPSTGYVAVSAVTSSTQITIPATRAPVVGSTLCWLSTIDWKLRTAKVTGYTATFGGATYAITLDTPFTGVVAGDWIFPGAERMAKYVAAILAGFAKLGPGEKTSSAGLLPRAMRRPLATQAWPSTMVRPFLRALTDAGEEVGDADYLHRSQTVPPLPSLVTDAPRVLTPRRIGVYPI